MRTTAACDGPAGTEGQAEHQHAKQDGVQTNGPHQPNQTRAGLLSYLNRPGPGHQRDSSFECLRTFLSH